MVTLFVPDAWAFGPGTMTSLSNLIGAIVWGGIGSGAGCVVALSIRPRTRQRTLLGALAGCIAGALISFQV